MKKFISLFISMAMLISMAIVPASAETYGKAWEFENPKVVTNSSGVTTVDGWVGNGSSLTFSDGILIQAPTSNNKFLLSPSGLNIDASKYKYLKVRMKNATSANAFFRFNVIQQGQTMSDYPASWTNIYETTLPIANDGKFNEYIVDLSKYPIWTGTIGQIRLCMSPWGGTGNCEYDYIRISDSGDLSAYDIDFNLANPTDVALGEAVDLTTTVTGGNATSVEYFVNGASVATVTEAPYTFAWTPAAVGAYYVKSVATFPEGKLESDTSYVSVYNPNIVEKCAYVFDFLNGSKEGWFASKGELVVENECLVNRIAMNDQNSFLQSVAGLAIDTSKYKYVKVRVAGEYSLAGQLSLQWITEEDPDWETTWTTGTKTCFIGSEAVINDGEFHDYVFDLTNSEGWTGTVTRMRIKVTPWKDTADMATRVDFVRVSDTLENGVVTIGADEPTPTPEPTPAPEIATEISVINQYVNGTVLEDGTEVDGDATSLQAVFTISGETAFNHVAFTVSDVTAEKDVTTVSGDGATVTYGIIVDAVIEAAAVTSAVSYVE